VFIPTRKDKLNKYFIEKHFLIDNSDCEKEDSKTIENIKAALKYTPLAASIQYSESVGEYSGGIWERWSDEKKPIYGHAIIISGWGVDKFSNKEYWILKNSWGTNWGDNGYFRVWMNDKTLNLECRPTYGFYGELIQKPGTEINALLPEAKALVEARKIQDAKNLEEEIKNMQKEFPQPITPIPENPYRTRPYDEFNVHNVSTGNQSTTKICRSVEQCVFNKLKNFYGITNTTTENELT